jgi:hypothetical protein
MRDYSDNGYAREIGRTVYGIDSAIVIVVFASALFWVSVGVAVWLLF